MYFFDAEENNNNEKENAAKNKSIADKLFEARAVFLCGEINQKVAKETMMMLTALATDSDDDITIYLNSQGGHVESGDTIHDMIRFVKPRVRIIGTGWVASAGTHIYLSVPQEDRLSLPNTRFLIHQPMGGVGGQATDIDIEAKEIVKMRQRLNEIISRETGQPLEKVSKDTDRNYWMSANEAIEYGIVGKIINSIDDLK
ncbi:MAG: ATP-dependent Clp protease proteolytic subunit [Deferribacteres bacterium]|nr:ATP-dependent Clp protease proteolytic subunit [candidate division KSB1 bacterium]MCB9502568.1 ATP-dependent Clp protease proteolytic subunit [Deferribacteres bacterium]